MSAPTLTLRIPFILLGRKDFQDPETTWPLEERYTAPVEDVHKALTAYWKGTPVRLGTLAEPNPQAAGWELRPTSSDAANDEADSQLSAREQAQLGANVWACPMLLQCTGIPLSIRDSGWRHFRKQVEILLRFLKEKYLDFEKELPSNEKGEAVRCWSLVCGENCRVGVQLVPPRHTGASESLDDELVKSVFLVFTALERELTLLTTPSDLLQYWPLSRFLEYRAIKQMGLQKDALWKDLRGKKNMTEKRQATMYQRDKEKWLSGVDAEDSRYERTKGGKREWWDVIGGMDFDDLLQDVKDFRDIGRQLAVSCEFLGEKNGGDNGSTGSNTPLTLPPSVQTQPTDPPAISSLTLNAPSTLTLASLLAHVELAIKLLHLVHQLSYPNLANWLQTFRQLAFEFPERPLHCFELLLEKLDVSSGSIKYLQQDLKGMYEQAVASEAAKPNRRELHYNPFTPLQTHISTAYASERNYIPTYISRYTSTGGFHPTPDKRVYALLLKQEEVHKSERAKVEQSGKKVKADDGWMGGFGEVSINDAVEVEEDLEARARKSPDLKDKGKGGKRRGRCGC